MKGKAVMGAATIGVFATVVIALVLSGSFLVAQAPDVRAVHDAIVTVSPGIANCNELGNTFTVNVENDGASADSIFEVRIYNGSGTLSSFSCGPAPAGWSLFDFTDPFGYCEYKTSQFGLSVIDPGEDVDFSFDATMIPLSCSVDFLVSTLDNAQPIGEHEFNTPSVLIDCTPPDIQKMVGDPKVACDPVLGCNWWVTEDTLFEVWADDSTTGLDECNLGIDHCSFTVALDGVETVNEEFGGGASVHWNFTLEDDSNHAIAIHCEDLAGNEAWHNQTDKVDHTPPQTTKHFEGPQKIDDGVEWIDGVTTIHFTPVDPDPTGFSCNIGVDQTLYRNTIVDDDFCFNPSTCSDAEGSGSWLVYNGTNIEKDEESCHLLEFYSIDELGNTESIQTNCFFVDKTPPNITKTVGEPKVSCDSKGDDSCDWYITQSTPITLHCEDVGDHPSGDVTIFWRYRVDEGAGYGPWTPIMNFTGEEFDWFFPEDSKHELEYWCTDAVGKESTHYFEVDKVDSEVPIITKTMIGLEDIDWSGDCPPLTPSDICYVGPNSGVNVSVVDGGLPIHLVDDVFCEYTVHWESTEDECDDVGGVYDALAGLCEVEEGSFSDNQEIFFNQDSTHDIFLKCMDGLGNWIEDRETFLVDHNPPDTTKMYGDHFFSCTDWCEETCYGPAAGLDCVDQCEIDMCGGHDAQGGDAYPHWITSSTNVSLWSDDEKIGTDTIHWRVSMGDDVQCEFADLCTPCIDPDLGGSECGPWNEVDVTPGNAHIDVTIPEDSCHIIEYFAVDEFNNQETLNWQCVFVDNQPPVLDKQVGDPSKFIGEGGDASVCEPPDSSGATIDPDMLDIELEDGDSFIETKKVTLDEIPIGKVDLVFLFDLTGSMGDDLDEVKSDASDMMADIDALVADAAFGVGSFMDYTAFYDACGYAATYGSAGAGDVPFSLDIDVTTDTVAVDGTISSLVLGSGVDGPESYTRALYESQFFDWRPGAKRIVVIFEDNVPHDCDLADYGCGGSTGVDPGPDGAVGGGDDLVWADVTADLVDAGITVIALEADSGVCDGPWDFVTAATGGVVEEVGTGDIADTIVELVENETAEVGILTLMPQDEFVDWVSWEPDSYLDVPGGSMVEFNITITVPDDTLAGDYHFFIKVVGDGAILAVQEVWINVTGDGTTPGPECEGGDGIDWMVTTDTVIELTCEDPEPHPVDHSEACFKVTFDGADDTESYCSDELEDGYCCVPAEEGYQLSFNEDSEHELEFFCRDALWNEGEADLEFFAVETVPPVTNLTFLGPFFEIEDCFVSFTTTCWMNKYIDTDSTIELEAEDPEPHPSGVMDTFYRVDLVDDGYCDSGPVFCQSCEATLDPEDCSAFQKYTGPINIPDESCHVIEYFSTDMLNNTEESRFECVFVDKTPPEVEKTIGDPVFTCYDWCYEECHEGDGADPTCLNDCLWGEDTMCSYDNETDEWFPTWVASDTEFTLDAEDQEPHPSGVQEINYRITLVDDENCEQPDVCDTATGTGSFTSILANTTSFTIGEESCHLIEYFAVDNVEKTGETQNQCIFVDDTGPLPNKTVGEKKELWDGTDSVFYPNETEHCWDGTNESIDCWKVTTLTPITLDCHDPDPHPVDHNQVCFNVDFDGVDITEDAYCDELGGTMNDGYCCMTDDLAPFTLYFGEESEHNLKFFCEDALGNQGPVDEEKFKVEGENFEIWLNLKWNLVSVPFVLLNDTPENVFEDVADHIDSVWYYDAETNDWLIWTPNGEEDDSLDQILPGRGYWVLALNDTELLIGGSLFSPAKTPPSTPVVGDAWNLIGFYGNEDDDTGDPIFEYHEPDLSGTGKVSACALNTLGDDLFDKAFTSLWTYYEPFNPDQWIDLDKDDYMNPGAGYWIFVQDDGTYAPATTCTV